MKIRIFALAKELGLDSKVLIDLCNQAGLNIKASALASITPEERDMVMKFLEGKGTTTAPEPPAPEPMAPIRPAPTNAGRVRSLPKPGKKPEGGVPEAPADTEPATAVEQPEAPAAAEAPAEPVAAPVADAPAPAAEVAPEAAEPDEDTSAPGKKVAAEAAPESAADSDASDKPSPLRREDFMPVRGGGRMREMKPIGTVKEARKPKSKGPALPNIAAPPTYQPPVAKAEKKKDEPVQKPDMPLTPEMMKNQGPLARQMQTRGQEPRAPGRRRPAKGSLLKQLQQDRQARREARQPRRKRGKRGPIEHKTSAQIVVPITVRSLSEALGRPARAILSHLFKQGKMATINEQLTEEDALDIAMEFDVDLEIRRGRDLEAELLEQLDTADPEEMLVDRPPIITILGHVDHGKTTLIDKLRGARVADQEAGGITQHIASYQVDHNGRKLTFVDTPGHAAFGEMRARGANVTDIVVLVVAADDGVMPQTEECISHAKAAGVPIVVAMNKIDLPDIDEQRVLSGLAQHDILPAEWGGDVEIVRTSGETGQGLEDLLETLLVTSELHEFTANPDRPAVGVCLEAFRDEGRGVIAWFIVQKGTLRIGDVVLCGGATGRVRAMYNDKGEELEEAPPSTPVKITGLDSVPGAGDHFFVMEDIDEARTVAQQRTEEGRATELAKRTQPITIETILAAGKGSGAVQDLPLILKADTPGSLEALRSEIAKFEHDEVRVQVIHEGVGGVNESDVYLASASEAVIIAFHVIPEDRAALLADQEGVEIRRYDIIYEITDHIRQALEGMLRPEKVQVATGRALVLRTFHISRFGTIAGCRILNGTIGRDNRVNVIRDQKILNDYRIASLKREKEDVKEVREGMECGIRLDGFNDIKEGDLLEAYRIDEIQRTLDD